MPAIKLNAFSGEQPRIIPRLLPDTASQMAVNVRLDDGGLTPTRTSVQVAEIVSATAKTIYHWKDEWLNWQTEVDAAPGPVADDRLYFTGDGVPKVLIDGTIYPLALPFPAAALTATVSGASTADIVTRTYVYTYVSSYGEETEPSPASNPVDWRPGQSLTLSGFIAPPAGTRITLRRIYRSQTGQSGTFLYFIAEQAATAANFVDTVPVDDFQEPIPSINYNAPPAGLTGLTAMPNGIMAAFVGKKLYFSEPFQPHAWPEIYALSMDSPIVGLGAIGSSVVVMTTGQPYFVTGSTPDSMTQVKLEENLPCINARGIADLGTVICYPSNEGLVAVSGNGSIATITQQLFNRDDWLALSPSTFVAGQISGRYIAFYDTLDAVGNVFSGAIFIDVAGTPFLIRASQRVSSVFYEVATGALFYLQKASSGIFRFDSPAGAREKMYWRSKRFVLPYPENFGAILVDAEGFLTGEEQKNQDAQRAQIIQRNKERLALGSVDGELNAFAINGLTVAGDTLEQVPGTEGVINVGVFADGKKVAQVSKTNVICRLPSGFKARTWEIDVSGDIEISQIVMGTTVAEVQGTV